MYRHKQVGVLAASFLLPIVALMAFARAQTGMDPETACVENVRQITRATLMYAQDWDDSLPRRARSRARSNRDRSERTWWRNEKAGAAW